MNKLYNPLNKNAIDPTFFKYFKFLTTYPSYPIPARLLKYSFFPFNNVIQPISCKIVVFFLIISIDFSIELGILYVLIQSLPVPIGIIPSLILDVFIYFCGLLY